MVRFLILGLVVRFAIHTQTHTHTQLDKGWSLSEDSKTLRCDWQVYTQASIHSHTKRKQKDDEQLGMRNTHAHTLTFVFTPSTPSPHVKMQLRIKMHLCNQFVKHFVLIFGGGAEFGVNIAAVEFMRRAALLYADVC
jgi:hypothetical protein